MKKLISYMAVVLTSGGALFAGDCVLSGPGGEHNRTKDKDTTQDCMHYCHRESREHHGLEGYSCTYNGQDVGDWRADEVTDHEHEGYAGSAGGL